MHRFLHMAVAAGLCTLATATLAAAPDDTPDTTAGRLAQVEESASQVTSVQGPSLLRRLGLDLADTDMGQMGGGGAPPSTGRQEPDLPQWEEGDVLARLIQRFYTLLGSGRPDAEAALQRTFQLTGADLYRLNCRACHGPGGEGAPPEIKSLLDPVRGASPAFVRQRLAARGAPVGQAFAETLAAQAEASLRQRLAAGGQKMPAFPHLQAREIDALLEHLRRLARVPDAPEEEMPVTQSVARVGEHLVKGTCHTCHDATGPGGGHMAMMRGVIPSLASLPQQKSPGEVVSKVHSGRSGGMMGMGGRRRMGGMMGRMNRMPAFPYLTEAEVVAGYLYLATTPPRSR